MIKNIIFDLGRVLINFEYNRFFELVDHDVEKAIPLMNEFDRGKISKTKFYTEMKKIYDFDHSQAEFEAIWCENFRKNSEMIDLAKKLSAKYNIYILSNTDEIHFPFIWRTFPSLHIFEENLLLSYELGLLKPDPEIYAKALASMGLKPEETIFIDDKLENVKAAEKFGLQVIWHRSFSDTKHKLSKCLTEKM